jgi:hypothetical protein
MSIATPVALPLPICVGGAGAWARAAAGITVAQTSPPAIHAAARRPPSVAVTAASVTGAPLESFSGGCHAPPLRRARKTCGTPASRLM